MNNFEKQDVNGEWYQKPAAMPTCPGCKLQPLPIMMHEVNTPRGLILGLICCAECGHVVQTLVVGMVEAQLVGKNGEPIRMIKH